MISLQVWLMGLVSLLSAKAVLAQNGSMMQGGGWGMGWMGGYGGMWGPLVLVAVLVAVVIVVMRGRK